MSGTRAGRQVQRGDRVDTRTRKQHSTSRIQGARIEWDECSAAANGRRKREGGGERRREREGNKWIGGGLAARCYGGLKTVLGSRAQSGIGEKTLGFTWRRPGGDGRWANGRSAGERGYPLDNLRGGERKLRGSGEGWAEQSSESTVVVQVESTVRVECREGSRVEQKRGIERAECIQQKCILQYCSV